MAPAKPGRVGRTTRADSGRLGLKKLAQDPAAQPGAAEPVAEYQESGSRIGADEKNAKTATPATAAPIPTARQVGDVDKGLCIKGHLRKPGVFMSAKTGGNMIDLPDWLPGELWAEWIDHRREMGKRASVRSQRMTIRKLDRLRNDYDVELLIEFAIEREWQGIYAHQECLRDATHQHRDPRGYGQRRATSAVERVREGSAHLLRVVGEDD